MSEAAAGRLMECAKLGLKARFEDKPPKSYDEVIAAIEEAEKG